MKKLLHIIIMFPLIVFSQINNDLYFAKSDLVSKDNIDTNRIHVTKFIKLRNGLNDFSTVKIDLFGNNDLISIDILSLNKIIDSISENVKDKLNPSSTYIPTSIVLRKRENDWYSNIFFSGQDKYGNKSDQSSMATVSNEGEIIMDYGK